MVSNIEQNNTVTLGVVKAPQLLHIPVLYEESTAVIDWQSIAGAVGYELEQSLDGEAFVLVYSGIGTETPAPDQSLTWSDINTMGKTWNEWETAGDNGDGLSWHEFSLLWPMGLDWNQLESMNKAWSELEDEDLTWRELEQLPPRGLTWNSMNATWLSWNDWNELGDNEDGLTWREFENLPPDNITRIAATVTIPLYSKYSAYRVRAFDAQGNYSEYKATGIIYHLPRSLAKYRPNCLHIPELREGKQARIVWGELYGASAYILERSLDGKPFTVLFNGVGTAVPPPFGGLNWEEIEERDQSWTEFEAEEQNWFELESRSTSGLIWGNANASHLRWDEFEEKELTWGELETLLPHDERHFAFEDNIPVGVRNAVYRIKAYNSTDSSQHLTTGIIPVTFYRTDSTKFTVESGGDYLVQLDAWNIPSFEGIEMAVTYPHSLLSLLRPMEQAQYGLGDDTASFIFKETGQSQGALNFMCEKKIVNSEWTGYVTKMRFRASRTGEAELKLD